MSGALFSTVDFRDKKSAQVQWRTGTSAPVATRDVTRRNWRCQQR